jgi:hypothetical protein
VDGPGGRGKTPGATSGRSITPGRSLHPGCPIEERFHCGSHEWWGAAAVRPRGVRFASNGGERANGGVSQGGCGANLLVSHKNSRSQERPLLAPCFPLSRGLLGNVGLPRGAWCLPREGEAVVWGRFWRNARERSRGSRCGSARAPSRGERRASFASFCLPRRPPRRERAPRVGLAVRLELTKTPLWQKGGKKAPAKQALVVGKNLRRRRRGRGESSRGGVRVLCGVFLGLFVAFLWVARRPVCAEEGKKGLAVSHPPAPRGPSRAHEGLPCQVFGKKRGLWGERDPRLRDRTCRSRGRERSRTVPGGFGVESPRRYRANFLVSL